MKEIPLTQGKVALVDDEDYERVVAFRWHAVRRPPGNGKVFYARRGVNRGGVRFQVLLHRFIMEASPDVSIDHKNGDGLDCRRENLRQATPAQNGRNRALPRNNTHGFKGLAFRKGRWYAQIGINRRTLFVGSYATAEEAARAYGRGGEEVSR